MSLILLATFTAIVILRICSEGASKLDRLLLENLWLFLFFRLLNHLHFVAWLRRYLWRCLSKKRQRRFALVALSVLLALVFGGSSQSSYAPAASTAWLSTEQQLRRIECQNQEETVIVQRQTTAATTNMPRLEFLWSN